MTMRKFVELCELYLIDPRIALENEQITKALAEKNEQEVERILKEDF